MGMLDSFNSGPDMSIGALAEGAVQSMLANSGLYEVVKEWAEQHPDEFKAKLSQWRKDVATFFDDQGHIKLNAMKQRLGVKEVAALLATEVFSEHVAPLLFSQKNYEMTRFDEAMNYFRAQNSGMMDADGQMVWPGFGPFSQLGSLWESLKMMTDGSQERCPVPVQSFLVMATASPSGQASDASMTPTTYAVLKAWLKSAGITLNRLIPGKDVVSEPGEKEIIYIPVPDGIPRVDGKVDMKLLDWYAKVWKGPRAKGEWCGVQPLAVALSYYTGDSSSVEEACGKYGVDVEDENTADLVALLKTIVLPGTTPPVNPVTPS